MANHHLRMPARPQCSNESIALRCYKRPAKTRDRVRECNKGKWRSKALYGEADGLQSCSNSNSLKRLCNQVGATKALRTFPSPNSSIIHMFMNAAEVQPYF